MKRKSRLNATTVNGAGCCRLHATRCPKMATGDESTTPYHVFSGALTLNDLLYFIAETVARPGRVLVTPHLMLGPLVMHLRDGGYLFCGWPPRSLSWKRTPLPHCPLPAQAPYQPWNKKTTEYSLVEHVVVASYGVSWLKVTCASGRFLYSTSPAMFGWVSYLLGVLKVEDVLYTSASPAVVIHCGDGMGVSNAVHVGDASSHYRYRTSFANEFI